MVVSANVDHVKYSINKSKVLLGFVGPQWEQHIVAELDSALNKWIDTVPDHRESRSTHAVIICLRIFGIH